jgi:hypothetical protein
MAYDNLLQQFRTDYKRAEQHGLSPFTCSQRAASCCSRSVLLLLVDNAARVRAPADGPPGRGEPPAQVGHVHGRGGLRCCSPRSRAPACSRSSCWCRCSSGWWRCCTSPRPVRSGRRPRASPVVGLLGATILAGAHGAGSWRWTRATASRRRCCSWCCPDTLSTRPCRARRAVRGTTVLLIGAAVVSFLPDQPRPAEHRGLRGVLRGGAPPHARGRRGRPAAYFALRRRAARSGELGVGAGVLKAMDWLFALCIRGDVRGDST